jgi:hypothetical protein
VYGEIPNTAKSHAAVRLSADQAIVTATDTLVQFDTEIEDDGGNFDATTNYDYTVPITGIYLVTFIARFQTMAAGSWHRAWVEKDGNVIASSSGAGVSGFSNFLSVSTLMKMTAADVLDFWVRHEHGSNRNLSGGSTGGAHSRTVVEILRVG